MFLSKCFSHLISFLNRFLDPLCFGDYPLSMRERAQGRLPNISVEVSKAIKGSFDFLGINHYTTNYAMNISDDPLIIGMLNNDTLADAGVIPTGKAFYIWFLILVVLYHVNECSN